MIYGKDSEEIIRMKKRKWSEDLNRIFSLMPMPMPMPSLCPLTAFGRTTGEAGGGPMSHNGKAPTRTCPWCGYGRIPSLNRAAWTWWAATVGKYLEPLHSQLGV